MHSHSRPEREGEREGGEREIDRVREREREGGEREMVYVCMCVIVRACRCVCAHT